MIPAPLGMLLFVAVIAITIVLRFVGYSPFEAFAITTGTVILAAALDGGKHKLREIQRRRGEREDTYDER